MTKYRQQWLEQGYLVVPGAFSPEKVGKLFEICERSYAQWRAESTQDSEPDYHHYKPDAWSIIHLNHPKYFRDHPADLPVLLNAVADPFALEIVEEIFTEAPLFTQANYYIDPPSEPFFGGWHRDCQFFADGDEAKERADVQAESEPPRELHMHIPLVPTAATEVVPGSHRRWDSDEELNVRRHDRFSDAMPGALRLHLEPGDLAFFHVNALHRGLYPVGVPRRTLAVTYGRPSFARPATARSMQERRGYNATYQPWFLRENYLDGTTPETRRFFERFIETYRESWQPQFCDAALIGEKRHDYYAPYFREPIAT